MDAVEVAGLEHRYGSQTALAGVSLSVHEGEIFGILGPNGSGKTTLFRILATLLDPQGGWARVFGRDVAGEAVEVRSLLGIAFQSPSVDPRLTPAENLRHRGHLHGLQGRGLARRAADLLDRYGLRDRSGDRVGRLSGGLRRRVELAMAMLHRPRLLLLDEPTTALDPSARRDFWRLVDEVRCGEGVTVVVTTHAIEEGDRCDRVGILDRGVGVALGPPEDLRAEIGGDVVDIETRDSAGLAARIRERMGVDAAPSDRGVRIRHREAHRLVGELVETFRGEIRAVRVGRPTLADVFFERTGRTFREGAPGSDER